MRIRIDKDLTFTVLEADGARARYIVLFTVREEETGREYLVYTDDKVRAFRRDPVYGSRFRRDGADLLLKAVETYRRSWTGRSWRRTASAAKRFSSPWGRSFSKSAPVQ